MILLIFLIIFPVLAAVMILLTRNERVRSAIVHISAAAVMIASILLVLQYHGQNTFFELDSGYVTMGIFLAEAMISLGLFYLGLKHKKYLASAFAIIQLVMISWYEFGIGHDIHASNNLHIDGLSSIIVLIIGVIGSLIIIYAVGYMRDYQKHAEGKDRRPWFFFVMFVFMSAMFGIVLSNNLAWMLFFWEVTTACSFLLIGFTKTEEATDNSFRALTMNLLGGIGFTAAIIIVGSDLGIAEMDKLIEAGLAGAAVMLPVCLLVFAGIVKAAQMPFHSWLLGAMVAPTPVSALLHSSTMVKAGVFLVIKLSPLLGTDAAGYVAMSVGGVTFLLASMAAISQSNAKRVLAYSTIANLGLIIACAGVGTPEAVWAAIMLTIFHAVTKSLLFLCVGTAEHNIGSRDIEDMDGLFSRMPRLAGLMIIGIMAMFLAPFGMLVAKWSSMASFVDAQNVILIICVCFGSAVTIFYWGKWLGKMVAVMAGRENTEGPVHRQEWFATGTLAAMTLALCALIPVISSHIAVPALGEMFTSVSDLAIPSSDLYIVGIITLLAVLLPLFYFRVLERNDTEIRPIYMCGVGLGDNLTYSGSMGNEVEVSIRNWYMHDWFGEERIGRIGIVITAGAMLVLILYSALMWTGAI
ncbi:MAG: hypothetical protein LBU30_02290 [Candidatus Methanoplasma sp.]|jgi:ech hydrogenase subunit A|nr:hypothetical protein [Candidatus Methanoplasma sp.]